ncbi:putative Peptidase B [Cocos nucifera]|uniref:Putative Peptidase B n=1 Tax=Cocos nucifera TaxID=13894 RepID=A0A8K0N8Z5_COCNU|nr:putative Peptidase B [Cocos nucifera]
MKPAMPVVSLLLLLLLATTTQGIRLDEESSAAFHNNIHEKGSSMGGVNKVGAAPGGINGHPSGRSRKLMNKRMVTLKNERSKETVFDAAGSHRYSKEDVGGSGEDDLHVEPPVSKQPQSFPHDMLEIAGMDYSPAKRVPPIHN